MRRIGPLAAATSRDGVVADLGGFGALFDLTQTRFKDPVLVSGTDGVGTKVLIAIESGLHDTVGIDLVAMCANDLVVQGAEPLFFLDYFASGKLDVGVAEAVVSGIAEGCRQAGAALIGGETAEMPGLYGDGHYDLAGFCVGAVERSEILPRSDMRAGDVVIGLASSGVHSNGFSLVRRVVERAGLAWTDPCPFGNVPTVAEALLTPTSMYVKPCLAAIATGKVKAFAHITGGGLVENMPRVVPDGLSTVIDAAAWETPEVFRWLQEVGQVPADEMYRAFNAGIGMTAVVAASDADAVCAQFNDLGEAAVVIGEVREGDASTAIIENSETPWRS